MTDTSEFIHLLAAAKAVEDAFKEFGFEGYYDPEALSRMDERRQNALDLLRQTIEEVSGK